MAWGSIRRALVLALATGSSTACALVGTADATAVQAAGTLTVGKEADSERVETNRRGDALVVWRETGRGGRATIFAVRKRRGHDWGTPKAVASARTGLRLVDVALDERSSAWMLWARATGRTSRLAVATALSGRSAWAESRQLGYALYDGITNTAVQASIAASDDGATTVVWCDGGAAEQRGGQPGHVRVSSSTPRGVWSTPEVIWTGDHCSAPNIQVDGAGNAVLDWRDLPRAVANERFLSTRPVGGNWSLPVTFDSVVGDDQLVEVLVGRNGPPVFFSQLGVRALNRPSEGWTSPPRLPASAVQERWSASRDLLNWAPQLVEGISLVGETGGVAASAGAGGTGAVWVALASPTGGWRVERPDRLAEASERGSAAEQFDSPPAPVLTQDRSGNEVLTWMRAVDSEHCRAAVYRAIRRGPNRWSPRRVLGFVDERGCASGRLSGSSGSASLWWSDSSDGLTLRSVRPARPGTPPTVQLLTQTWSEIRRSGAIEFSCRMSVKGFCHVSLVAAARNAQVSDALELFCRPAIGRVEIVRAGQDETIRLPLSPGCYAGGPLPEVSRATVEVRFLAVSDAVGHTSSGRRSTVRIKP